MQPLQVEAAQKRLQQYRDEGREASLQLQLKAFEGAADIFDDFFESLRTVVLFHEWKLYREKLWEDWLAAQQHHMTVFNALHDRTAFAGSMYEDSSLQLMKLSRWKKSIRKGQSLLVEQQTQKLREICKRRPPLYIGEHGEPQLATQATVAATATRVLGASAATATHADTSSASITLSKNVPRQRKFERLMIDRMREIQRHETPCSNISSIDTAPPVPSPHNKVKFVIV